MHVVLYWAERETVPIPGPAGGDADLPGSLIEEYAVLQLEVKRSAASQGGIELARLKKTGGKWRLDRQFRPARAKA